MTQQKLNPEQFAILRTKALNHGHKTVRAIARYLGIAPSTYQKYMKDKRYSVQVDTKRYEKDKPEIRRAQEMINGAYDDFEQEIQKARENEDWDKVLRLRIEALKIARTESEVNRVNMVVFNQTNIDNRQQTVNIYNDFVSLLFTAYADDGGLVIPYEIQERIKGYILNNKEVES